MNVVFLQQLKVFGAGALLLVLAGCASYGVIDNTQQVIDHPDPDNYDLNFKDESEDENAVWLALSGGGTRAAALAYGVLQELNETRINDNNSTTALEAVDTISSVSGGSNKQPSLAQTLGSVSSIQMSRYTKTTEDLMKESMIAWGKELSTPDQPVSVHIIPVRFEDIEDKKERDFINAIPTSFSLTDEQVDALIKAGRELLRNQPEFKKLIQEFQKPMSSDIPQTS